MLGWGDRDPAHFGEFVHACVTTKAAVTTGFKPAKRHRGVVFDGGGINVAHAGFQLICHASGKRQIASKNGSRKAVFTIIRYGNGFFW